MKVFSTSLSVFCFLSRFRNQGKYIREIPVSEYASAAIHLFENHAYFNALPSALRDTGIQMK